ncbi:hypothetical protein Bpla01_42350 [Burkholderia plantarii]|nr:hypothetical protein Bpla01_42350 [Burkholderia plantarii]
MAALIGRPFSDEPMRPMKISKAPKMRYPIVSATLGTWLCDGSLAVPCGMQQAASRHAGGIRCGSFDASVKRVGRWRCPGRTKVAASRGGVCPMADRHGSKSAPD